MEVSENTQTKVMPHLPEMSQMTLPVARNHHGEGAPNILTTSRFVKYYVYVHIFTEKHLNEAMEKYKDAANEIKLWKRHVLAARWHNFPEVRNVFKDADHVDDYVIFDFRNNRYRLVTVIHYVKVIAGKQTMGHVYIRSFLTHKEYDNQDNWDKKYGTKKGKK
jgi:mRNA interferase HigB